MEKEGIEYIYYNTEDDNVTLIDFKNDINKDINDEIINIFIKKIRCDYIEPVEKLMGEFPEEKYVYSISLLLVSCLDTLSYYNSKEKSLKNEEKYTARKNYTNFLSTNFYKLLETESIGRFYDEFRSKIIHQNSTSFLIGYMPIENDECFEIERVGTKGKEKKIIKVNLKNLKETIKMIIDNYSLELKKKEESFKIFSEVIKNIYR